MTGLFRSTKQDERKLTQPTRVGRLPQGPDEKRWERVHIEADRRKPFAFVREVWQ